MIIVRFLREPLVHFLLIGAVVFAAFQLVREPKTATLTNVVEVTEQRAAELIRQFRKSVRRGPTPAEVESLIRSYVNEEVLVRVRCQVISNRCQSELMEYLAHLVDHSMQLICRS